MRKKEETIVVVANADGGGEQNLATRKAPDRFSSDLATRIAWSPDGNTIACAASSADARGYYQNVVGVSVADGSEKLLTSKRWGLVGQVAWLSNDSGLVMVAAEGGATQFSRAPQLAQLWHLAYPGGEARRITNDLNLYSDVTVTADSKALVTVEKNRVSNIWIAPSDDTSRARQITSGTSDGLAGLAWTPDPRIVYPSSASGQRQIWIMNADGSNRQQLTHEGENGRPSVSPDGRYIIFSSERDGRINIWRMDIDGNNAKQLTDGKSNANPHLSPDGRWVVYASRDHGSPEDQPQGDSISVPTMAASPFSGHQTPALSFTSARATQTSGASPWTDGKRCN